MSLEVCLITTSRQQLEMPNGCQHSKLTRRAAAVRRAPTRSGARQSYQARANAIWRLATASGTKLDAIKA
jgi:hypothetical protein